MSGPITRPGQPASRHDRRRFGALDGVRGAAALLVLLSHVGYETGRSFTGIFGGLLSRAEIGVTIFFVLSGFLLYRPYALNHLDGRPAPRTGRFFWRRAIRILPAYWVLLLVISVTLHRQDITPRIVAVDALLVHIYQPGYLLDHLAQTWTLATEVSWYLLLPFIALALRRRPGRSDRAQLSVELTVVGAMIICSIGYAVVARGTTALDPFVSGFWLPHYVGWFGVGMAFAVLQVWLDRNPGSRWSVLHDAGNALGTCWAVALVLYLIAGNAVAGPRILVASSTWEGLIREGLYSGVAALLVLPCIFGDQGRGNVRAALAGPVGAYLGNISYAVFLWHFPLKQWTFQATDTQPFSGHFWLNLVVLLVATLVVASASWYLLERPVLRLKDWTPRFPPLRKRREEPVQSSEAVADTHATTSAPNAST